jgi:conjugal transfer/entry exclusion protein
MKALDNLEYELFVSEDSQYLKLLEQLNGYKDEVIKLNAQLSINENVTDITAEIKVKEELINQITTQIEGVMNLARQGIEAAKKALNEAYNALEKLEEKIAELDFNEILTGVETDINNAKDGICESFEAKYAADIAKIKESIEARKNLLEGSEADK